MLLILSRYPYHPERTDGRQEVKAESGELACELPLLGPKADVEG